MRWREAETSRDRPALPQRHGLSFRGKRYLTGFALPNFFFHATTAYAMLRANGVPVGKPDFLQHLGPPNLVDGA